MESRSVLLLVGSFRRQKSTSNSIGQYLMYKLSKEGFKCDTIYVYDAIADDPNMEKALQAFNDNDLIIFSYPLYVDSLPAGCIKFLENLTDERAELDLKKEQSFLAIGNCGFYEKEQIMNSLNVCKFFAAQNNLKWLGGIPVGGGPQINGMELESIGEMSKKLRLALEAASKSIAKGEDLPMDKILKLTNPPEPKFMYFFLANIGFKCGAKKNGVLKSINDRPYIEN